ncbi:hypothetical protein BDW02DRAFT_572106 [Decorospora gaudefroyi]|uniref:Fungal N-terminal domain-containing protein n=1 Tax=Decorospora gaudefroyi TaxID=184978 RepID=A0A6A5K2T0_9PLEO|nr:hypothetical protein BDW02DRAFT_572106 [Decorospora gaudefroyi]
MAEIFGAVIAGVTLTTELTQLCPSLHKLVNQIRNAPRELSKLVDEVRLFTDIYLEFYWAFDNDMSKSNIMSPIRHLRSPVKLLAAWTEGAIRGFHKLLGKVGLLIDGSRSSVVQRCAARIEWYFNEKEVKCTRASLSVARQSISALLNIRIIGKIDEEIQMLERAIRKGNRRIIEKELEMSVEQRLQLLTRQRQYRRRQRHCIEARLDEAKEDYFKQREQTKEGNAFVPKPRELLRVIDSVKRSVDKVMPLRESRRRPRHPSILAPSTRSSESPESSRPTDSTAIDSFVSKPSSFTEPAASASPATSAEELEKTSDSCGKCTDACACSTTEPSSAILSCPPSLASPPPLRPSAFEHPSHRFDRSWQQLGTNHTVYQSNKGTCPVSEDDPCAPWQALKELAKPDPERERVQREGKEFEELLARDEASRRKSMMSEYSEEPNEEEHESDDGEEVEETSEEEAQPSPFQPVAGVHGNYPPGWRKRHERRESPDDHWHRKL